MHYVRGRGDAPSRLLIATQSPDGKVCAPFLVSLIASLPAIEGWRVDFVLEAGNCHVDDARNAVVRQFLRTDATDLLFIDSDVGWTVEGIVRLLSHDVDLVAGVYPKKQADPSFPVRPLPGPIRAEDNGLVEVEGAPTGFMRIRRSVLERMVEAHKDRQFIGSDGGEPYTILFERTFEDGHRWSGDYAFCRKWRGLGGRVCVDPELDFIHEGSREWTGRLGDFWRRRAGLESQRFCLAMRRLMAGDASPKTLLELREGWDNPFAAPVEMLVALHRMAKGRTVLEAGSGLTSLVMAAVGGEVHALESDLAWYRRMTVVIEQFGLTNLHLHYAPLELSTGWYGVPDAVRPLGFGLVVCDGPARSQGDRSALWRAGLDIEGAIWVLDDVRADEVNGRKTAQFDGLHPWVIAEP